MTESTVVGLNGLPRQRVAPSAARPLAATICGGNAKAMGLEPDTDGLPDMQIIIYVQDAAHGSLLPLSLRYRDTGIDCVELFRRESLHESYSRRKRAACLPPNVYTARDTPHRLAQLHRAPSLLSFRQSLAF